MDSTNINTNVAQIILPADMEIRKIKKPKPKTSNEKKKALKELKETLKAYDSVVSIAADKKIQLPAELGILPDNIADINSVKELKAFTGILKTRIQQINQLIAQGAQKQKTGGLFSEGMGQRLPVMPTRIVPSPLQPNIIQPQIPQNPQPINPNTQQPGATQAADSDAEKTLEQLRQEILNKLSPEDRAKAEEELEKEQQEQPAQPAQPIDPKQPAIEPPQEIDTSDTTLFETDLNFDVGGGNKIDLVAPAAWPEFYRQYRVYIEGITTRIQKVDKGVIVLPPEDEAELNKTRQDILDSYGTWSSKLVDKQTQLLDKNPLKQLNSEMLKELELDPKDIIKEIAKAQNIEIKEITNEETSIEKGDKAKGLTLQATEFLNKIKQNKSAMDNIVMTIDELKERNRLNETMKDLNSEKANIAKSFDRLAGPDRQSVLNEFNNINMDIDNLVDSVNRKRGVEEIIIDPNTYIASTKSEAQQPPRIIPAGEPGGPQPDNLPIPRPQGAGSAIKGSRFVRDGVKVSQEVKGALGRLNQFATGSATQYTPKRREDIDIVLQSDKLKQYLDQGAISTLINDLPPATKARNAAARQLVREQILNRVLIAVADE